jgi:hypothetical protein
MPAPWGSPPILAPGQLTSTTEYGLDRIACLVGALTSHGQRQDPLLFYIKGYSESAKCNGKHGKTDLSPAVIVMWDLCRVLAAARARCKPSTM